MRTLPQTMEHECETTMEYDWPLLLKQQGCLRMNLRRCLDLDGILFQVQEEEGKENGGYRFIFSEGQLAELMIHGGRACDRTRAENEIGCI